MSNLADCGLDQFNFASFSFPKYVWTLDRRNMQKRLADRKNMCCGAYYHAPKSVNGSHPGKGFYLDSDGQPFIRWQWADKVDGSHIAHEGWYCDRFQDQTIRGFVAILPHGRYLAGWSMGEGMASEVDGRLFDDIVDAASAADSMAKSAADREREYQEKEEERFQEEERERELEEAADRLDSIVDDYRAA